MSTTQRNFAGAAAIALVALLSWFTISPGTPQIYAPLNILVVLPAFMTSNLFHGAYIIAVVVVPLFFCLWCWPVLRGSVVLPTRSYVLFVLAVVLSAVSLIFGSRYGIQYQSTSYVVGV